MPRSLRPHLLAAALAAAPLAAAPLASAPAHAARPKPSASSTPATAAANATERSYVVKAGDTCLSIALKLYGSRAGLDVIHANNDLGPAPHHLKPGQRIRLPPLPTTAPQQPSGPDARLTFVRNSVEAYTPARHAGQRDEPLSRGHRVSTLASSSAEVTYRDTSRLQLGEHTLVVILGDEGAGKRRSTTEDTTLVHGTLRAHLGDLAGGHGAGGEVPIQTAGGQQVALAPGEALLAVDEKRTARLSVYKGRGTLRSKGKAVDVMEGFGTRAEAGKAPEPPRPLPAPPTWSAPPAELVVTRGEPAAIVAGYRASGPAPAMWHVQLARDEAWNDLVVDGRVPAAVTSLEAKELAPGGSYFARVAAIDAAGLEGPFGPAVRVRVAAARVVAATGKEGARAVIPDGVRCAVDGGPAQTGTVELARGRAHALQCSTDGATAVAALDVTAAEAGDAAKPAPPPPATPPATPPPAAPQQPPPAGRSIFVELGVHGTLVGTTGDVGLGGGGGVEVGLATRPRGWGGVSLRARGTYERYGYASPCSPTVCVPGAVHVDLTDDTLSLLLALTYRLPAFGRWTPYLSAQPLMNLARIAPPASDPMLRAVNRTTFGIGGAAGAEVTVGPGALFLELGYRWLSTQSLETGDQALGGFVGSVGYRFHL